MPDRSVVVQLLAFGGIAAVGFGVIGEDTFLMIASGLVGYAVARVEDAIRAAARGQARGDGEG